MNLAEFERELILARTSDGRSRAKARGVKFGRPLSLSGRAVAGRYREKLQRQSGDDIEARRQPFRAGRRKRGAVKKSPGKATGR